MLLLMVNHVSVTDAYPHTTHTSVLIIVYQLIKTPAPAPEPADLATEGELVTHVLSPVHDTYVSLCPCSLPQLSQAYLLRSHSRI